MLYRSDYCDIDPRYGTLEDWDNLLKGVHDRGMKLMCVINSLRLSVLTYHSYEKHGYRVDIVINHTSDEVSTPNL
jgi:glycosidase